MNPTTEALTTAVEREAEKWPEVQRLMTHPGVGPLTARAFVLIIGTPERFGCGKQIGGYVGLIPSEDSSAGKQRLGRISKQGSSLLRYMLGEAAQSAARGDADWRRRYVHLAMRRQKNIAKVAMARRLAVRLYWIWRNGWKYGISCSPFCMKATFIRSQFFQRFGRRGRDTGAADLPHGFQRERSDPNYVADRHCAEKRDHDD
jgi:hypothetical protein